jgi:hypothetical protein
VNNVSLAVVSANADAEAANFSWWWLIKADEFDGINWKIVKNELARSFHQI